MGQRMSLRKLIHLLQLVYRTKYGQDPLSCRISRQVADHFKAFRVSRSGCKGKFPSMRSDLVLLRRIGLALTLTWAIRGWILLPDTVYVMTGFGKMVGMTLYRNIVILPHDNQDRIDDTRGTSSCLSFQYSPHARPVILVVRNDLGIWKFPISQ